MPYMKVTRQLDNGKWQSCVHKRGKSGEPEGERLGCHEADSKETAEASADKQIQAIGARTHAGGKSLWVTVEQMRAICPDCADEMVRRGLKTINLEEVKARGNINNLAEHLAHAYGSDPGFWTKCDQSTELANTDPEKRAAICARAHYIITGMWPGGHRAGKDVELPAEKAIDDLEEQAMRVSRAFREWFRRPLLPGQSPDSEVEELFSPRAILTTAVIVSVDGVYYRCPYGEDADGFVFASPDQWARVERVWVDVATPAAGDAAKEIDLDQRSSMIRDAIYAQLRPPRTIPDTAVNRVDDVWVRYVYDGYVIVQRGKDNFRIDYTFDETTGQVTLGQVTAVEQEWKPIETTAPTKAGRVQASRNVARLVPAYRLIRDILVDAGYDPEKLLHETDDDDKGKSVILTADPAARYAIVLPEQVDPKIFPHIAEQLKAWEESGNRFLVLGGGARIVPLEYGAARSLFPTGDDTLVALGGEIKALGNGRIGGYLIRYGDPQHTDLTGVDFFSKDTDYGPLRTSLVFFHHGKDGRLQRRILDANATLKDDDVGKWIEAQLALRDAYEQFIYKRVQEGKMGWSSGTASHLAERVPVGKAMWIKTWILGLDASITPTPCESLNMAVPLKSFPLQESMPDLGKEDAGASCLEAKTHAAALLTLIDILTQEVES